MEVHQDWQEMALSAGQLAIWHDISFNLENEAAYNVGAYWEFVGTMEADRIDRAVQRMVDTTAALRLHLQAQGDDRPPCQRLAQPRLGHYLRTLDFSEEPDPVGAARKWMEHDVSSAIELTTFPAFRIVAIKLAPDWHYLYMLVHHLFVDGVGFNILQRRFSQAVGMSAELASTNELDDDCQRYVAGLTAYEDSARYEAAKQYWKRLHETAPNRVTLSVRQPQRLVDSATIRSGFQLIRDDLVSLCPLAQRVGATLSEILFASVVLFVHRMTGEEDIPIGLPVHGRPAELRHRFVWMCTNVLPLRFAINSDLEIHEFFSAVVTQFREALLHQDYRYESIRRDVGRLSDAGLFDISVNIIRGGAAPVSSESRRKLRVDFHALRTGPTRDLQILIADGTDAAGALWVQFIANPAMYDQWEIDNLVENFATLLKALSGSKD